MSASLNRNKIGELETISIEGEGFRAVVLLQGSQLIHFVTDDEPDNWLWVSEQAVYKQGVSVRGGVPVCWPVFGVFDANPPQVQQSFKTCQYDVSKHGYARKRLFELDSFETEVTDSALGNTSQLILSLPTDLSLATNKQALNLKVAFNFSKLGFSITLITQNNAPNTIHYTQALHTYLPTQDILKTHIAGLSGVTYSDTLSDWRNVTQQGDIRFEGETDRIYHDAPNIQLNTPAYHYQLTAKGSQSTVIWNPWQTKSKDLSQFKDDDYQRMLCIETANAHLDSVALKSGDMHHLSMTLQRRRNDSA